MGSSNAETTGVGILGYGSFLPPTVRDNSYWAPLFEKVARLERSHEKDILAIERRNDGERAKLPAEIAEAIAAMADDPYRGSRYRHVIADDADVADMEVEAARRALRDAGVRPDEIDLVLVNSMVPDRIMPSDAPAVQARCELVNASAWSLDVGCASFQPHLITAAAMIRSGMCRYVLVVLSSAASRVMDYDVPSSIAFGDGASAVVVGAVPSGFGLLGHWMRTDGTLREGVVFAPVTDGQPVRRWDRCAGPTRLCSFDVDVGKEAGRRSTQFCREASEGALRSASLSIGDVDLYVGNQSLGWLVDACRRGLGLRADQAFDTFAEVGNIGAAAVPFNLERARAAGRVRHGDLVLTYSPGAGLTRASAVYRFYDRNAEDA